MRLIIFGLIAGLLAGCDFVGGAETLVRGSNNLIAADGSATAVADALARLDGTPEVTDAELTRIYDSIRGRALEGDLPSAHVLLRLAAIQREPEPEEE